MLNPIKWYKKRVADKRYKDGFIYAAKEIRCFCEPVDTAFDRNEFDYVIKDARIFCNLLLRVSLTGAKIKNIDLNSYKPSEFKQKVKEATTYLEGLLNERDTRIRNT